MSRRPTFVSRPRLAVSITTVIACANAFCADDDGSKWFLVKAPTGQDSKKPAQVIFARDDENSSTLTNVAALWKRDLMPTNATMATSLGASVGFSKNTLSQKRYELFTVGGNVQSVIALTDSKLDTVDLNADYLLENDREHGARGWAGIVDATLISASWLHLDPNLERGKKENGLDGWLYPSLGLYHRRVSSTNSPSDSPVGSHGGIYAGLRGTFRWFSLNKDAALINRLSVEAAYLHARESSVSGDYNEASYRYGEVSVNFLLYGEPSGKGWKPILGFTRSKGTNRVANEPQVNQSQLSFKLSYGV